MSDTPQKSTSTSSHPISSTSSSSSTGGGLSSLRSLRNLLPFGSSSSKHHHQQQQRHSSTNQLGLIPSSSSSTSNSSNGRNSISTATTGATATTTHPVRSSFATISALRKSIHGERSVSAPQLRQEKSLEDFPLLTIDLSHHLNEPLLNKDDLQAGLGLYTIHTTDSDHRLNENNQNKNQLVVDPTEPRSAPPTSLVFDTLTKTSGMFYHYYYSFSADI